jgi:hypothetical protein
VETVKQKPYLQALASQGRVLRENIERFFQSWPKGQDDSEAEFDDLPDDTREAASDLITDVRRWFNLLKAQVLPYLLYDQQTLYYLLRRVEAGIKKKRYKRPYPESMPSTISIRDSEFHSLFAGLDERKSDIEVWCPLKDAKNEALEAIDTAISLIYSVPADAPASSLRALSPSATFSPNSAFILMWMDPANPELDDVCNAIKEVCRDFGITALRADDVQHEERITEVVLAHITGSEFLIADLTGERPNVYYEVGYAHAMGKRPILYRKAGTRLHFDLSVHNVPEYRNLTDLKGLLRKRFEAILGRKALASDLKT